MSLLCWVARLVPAKLWSYGAITKTLAVDAAEETDCGMRDASDIQAACSVGRNGSAAAKPSAPRSRRTVRTRELDDISHSGALSALLVSAPPGTLISRYVCVYRSAAHIAIARAGHVPHAEPPNRCRGWAATGPGCSKEGRHRCTTCCTATDPQARPAILPCRRCTSCAACQDHA